MSVAVQNNVSPRAVGLVCASALLWGLYWIPVRALESFGVSGVWTALLFAVSGLLASIPLLAWGRAGKIGWPHIAGALIIGSAFTLYAIALTYTEIVRVVLLFYLAPAWSTIIECLFYKRVFTLKSLLGLFLSFLGIVIIFKGELPLDGLGALGDWMAFAAGLCWSIGSALMFSSNKISVPAMTTLSYVGAALVSVVCLVFLGEPISEGLALINEHWRPLLLVCALLAVFYLAPVTAITLWGATVIPPAMMSFLLTIEVIAAVLSSAVLLGEPFGLIEFAGTLLIIAGALTEVIKNRV